MFSSWLLQEMNKKDWTQADLARASGLTTAAISRYMTGRIPEEESAKKIARAFKIPPEQVFRAAGILPPVKEKEQLIEIILHELDTLSPEDKADVIEFIEFKARRKRKKAQ